jgi:hypothetical protein
MRDEDLGLWGAYFWALSAARHTLAHQLRSPTGSFGIHLGLIGEFAASPEPRLDRIRHYADVMSQEVERLKIVLGRGIDQLRSGLEPGESRPGLGEVLADLDWLMKPLAMKNDGEWVLLPMTGDPMVAGDPIALHHALFVLNMLAILDLPNGGRIEVAPERTGREARITIRQSRNDGGAGLSNWFPALEAGVGPPGILGITLRGLEQHGFRWSAPASPGEPIALHLHLEDTES